MAGFGYITDMRYSNAARLKPSQKSAFTLIELLVMIAIVAVLAAIFFPVFSQASEKTRQTACATFRASQHRVNRQAY